MLSASKSIEKKTDQNILSIHNIRNILQHISYNTWLGIDLDNTVIESTQELGSDQWFENTIKYACQLHTDKEEACRLVIVLYHAVQHHAEMKAVEEIIIRIIKRLQNIIPIIPITARGESIIRPTLRQLGKVGIDFSPEEDLIDAKRIELDVGGDHPAVYYQGILFCSGMDKGKCLKALFDYLKKFPEHFVMADDKEKHLLSVKKVIEENGGRFTGLRYGYLDEKVKNFNMIRALNQLIEISHKLSLDAQLALKKLKIKITSPDTFFSKKNSLSSPDIHLMEEKSESRTEAKLT